MSCLNIRGEIIRCEHCGYTHKMNYIGGNRCTQISDLEITNQLEFSKQLLSPKSNERAELFGHYYHRFAVCNNCLKFAGNYTIIYNNHIFLRYERYLDKLTSLITYLEDTFYQALLETESESTFFKINPQEFTELKSAKHFGLKKEKRRLVEEYILNIIYPYLTKQIKSNPIYKAMCKKIHNTEKKILAMLGSINTDFKFYLRLPMNKPRNLNPFICSESSVRIPIFNLPLRKFYTQIEFDLNDIKKSCIDNDKFLCRFERNVTTDSIDSHLVSKMVKLNFENN